MGMHVGCGPALDVRTPRKSILLIQLYNVSVKSESCDLNPTPYPGRSTVHTDELTTGENLNANGHSINGVGEVSCLEVGRYSCTAELTS